MITKTEIHYEFEITTKPDLDDGVWTGHGTIHYVDEDLTFAFTAPRNARVGAFGFAPGGDPAVEERVEVDLLRILAECYDFAMGQARQRFAADLYDSGAGIVSA